MSASVGGDRAIIANLNKLMRKIPKQVAGGVLSVTEEVMALSKTKFVPVDLGALRNSGFVKSPVVKGATVEVTLGFGGASAPYAIIQHENEDFRHTVGTSKYLEKAVMQEAPSMPARIARRIKI